jgi:hypothetical protein
MAIKADKAYRATSTGESSSRADSRRSAPTRERAAPSTKNAGAHERLYRARSLAPEFVNVPPARFLMFDGTGSPGGDAFQQAIGALYAIAYTAKFALTKAGGPRVKVPPLEGLYAATGLASYTGAAREHLQWTLMLRLPEPIDDASVEHAREAARHRRSLPALDGVRVEQFAEGRCAQVLHVGPYSSEPATIELLHAFIGLHGLAPRGRHHEIYLGDPRRAQPERLKTILRQPVG